MGKGRTLAQAMKSKITPFGRWVPKPNANARCVGLALSGFHPKAGSTAEKRAEIKSNFSSAASGCKKKGK